MHTDSELELAHVANGHIGELKLGLFDAKKINWQLVDTITGLQSIFPSFL
jgi:hypothetical protein